MSYIEGEIYIVVSTERGSHNFPLYELVVAKKFKDEYIENDNTYIPLCKEKKFPNGEFWQILRDEEVIKFFN